MDEEFLDAVYVRCQGDLKCMKAALKSIRSIRQGLAEIARDEAKELERHREAKLKLTSRRTAIEKSCDHPLMTHHSDPAGGSDSFYSCEVCGRDDLNSRAYRRS